MGCAYVYSGSVTFSSKKLTKDMRSKVKSLMKPLAIEGKENEINDDTDLCLYHDDRELDIYCRWMVRSEDLSEIILKFLKAVGQSFQEATAKITEHNDEEECDERVFYLKDSKVTITQIEHNETEEEEWDEED